MNRIVAWTIALSLAGSSVAFAHGSAGRIMGTVTAVTPTTITVRAEDGDIVPVTVNESTSYRSGATGADPAAFADVTVGKRVVIDVGSVPGSTTAHSVRIGAATTAMPDAKGGS